MDNVAGSQAEPLMVEFFLADAAATDALGASLAKALPDRASRGAVVHLKGELGAGKTTCVRSLLRFLGVIGLIRSPTYTLVESYPVAELNCMHVDLYRLQGARDVEELDLRSYLGTPTLILIEWAERGGTAVPHPDLDITLEYTDDARRATLRSRSDLGRRWLATLAEDNSLLAYVSNLT